MLYLNVVSADLTYGTKISLFTEVSHTQSKYTRLVTVISLALAHEVRNIFM